LKGQAVEVARSLGIKTRGPKFERLKCSAGNFVLRTWSILVTSRSLKQTLIHKKEHGIKVGIVAGYLSAIHMHSNLPNLQWIK
jgi:hypothetical protein